jgi:cytochrome P450
MNFDDLLFTRAYLDDPYPVYARLRAEAPVYWSERYQRWFLTRYADIDASLRGPHWSANRLHNIRPPERETEIEPVVRVGSKQMLFADPPDHTRLRGLVSKTFTPRVVERMRTRVEQLVDALLDKVADKGEMDVIRDLAYPLPAIVILDVLGLPQEERDQFKAWSVDLANFLGNVVGDPEIDRQAVRGVVDAVDRFATLADELRQSPRDDLLTALVQAEEAGDRLSREELLANTMVLLLGGHETTTNLIGNGLLALLRHPDQLQRLRDDPSLLPTAVEEFLRYDGSIQSIARIATVDQEIRGKLIRAGQRVMTVLGAANRDPEQFERPDELDVGRHPNRHIAFGLGIHFCIGAPLARLEAPIAFRAILERFPNLRLATDRVEWQPNPIFRGLKALPVAW